MRYVTVLNQKTVRSVKSKYKKYDNGGKPKKKKRSKKTEFARQLEELALAAKIMMLEGIMDPEDMRIQTLCIPCVPISWTQKT